MQCFLLPVLIILVTVYAQQPTLLGTESAGLPHVTAGFHATFTHPAYPRHSVRVKRVDDFCETTGAKTYAGYVDIEARHMFFYFFESRNDPASDPVLVWVNGGPGCSSTTGLFLENGPCKFDNGNMDEPTHNPYSWNNNASMIFLEQPVGTGFSYSEHGEHATTTLEAAEDFVAFINIWFDAFSRFRGRALHLTGESYAGRMLPVFASTLLDANSRASTQGREPINLESVLIVNGFTNYLTMSLTSYDMLCTNASLPPLLPISTCMRMKAAMPRCEKWYTQSCNDVWDHMSCAAAEQFCASELAEVAYLTGRNIYDLEEECPDGACEVTKPWVDDYLNRPDIRAKLGVDGWEGSRNITMRACSPEIRQAFTKAGDQLHSSNAYTEELLHRGVRVMHIVGATDWICNWVGNLREASRLSWSGQAVFNAAELREWAYQGKRAGMMKAVENLAFFTLDGAGHAAPVKRRPESLYILQKWLDGDYLSSLERDGEMVYK